MEKNPVVYLDNAATTALCAEALEAMKPYLQDCYANPAGAYQSARQARGALEDARAQLAQCLGASANEIYFTSGGTESDNWAVKGVAYARKDRGRHIVTTCIEHHAVLRSCEFLEQQGFSVTYLDVDAQGMVSPQSLAAAMRPDTVLVSIMTANNEIGTIQPIGELAAIAHRNGAWFHTDAVQAFGHIPLSVEQVPVDLLSVSAHKFHGPKGIGFLYVRNQRTPVSLLHGGSQERGRRAGTHNVAGAVGMARAAVRSCGRLQENQERQSTLRDYMIARIEREIPGVSLNGSREQRLPNNINFCFHAVDGESLLIRLDREGIYASAGAACASGSLDVSHVIRALGVSDEDARGALRFSLSEATTRRELDRAVDCLKTAVAALRGTATGGE